MSLDPLVQSLHSSFEELSRVRWSLGEREKVLVDLFKSLNRLTYEIDDLAPGELSSLKVNHLIAPLQEEVLASKAGVIYKIYEAVFASHQQNTLKKDVSCLLENIQNQIKVKELQPLGNHIKSLLRDFRSDEVFSLIENSNLNSSEILFLLEVVIKNCKMDPKGSYKLISQCLDKMDSFRPVGDFVNETDLARCRGEALDALFTIGKTEKDQNVLMNDFVVSIATKILSVLAKQNVTEDDRGFIGKAFELLDTTHCTSAYTSTVLSTIIKNTGGNSGNSLEIINQAVEKMYSKPSFNPENYLAHESVSYDIPFLEKVYETAFSQLVIIAKIAGKSKQELISLVKTMFGLVSRSTYIKDGAYLYQSFEILKGLQLPHKEYFEVLSSIVRETVSSQSKGLDVIKSIISEMRSLLEGYSKDSGEEYQTVYSLVKENYKTIFSHIQMLGKTCSIENVLELVESIYDIYDVFEHEMGLEEGSSLYVEIGSFLEEICQDEKKIQAALSAVFAKDSVLGLIKVLGHRDLSSQNNSFIANGVFNFLKIQGDQGGFKFLEYFHSEKMPEKARKEFSDLEKEVMSLLAYEKAFSLTTNTAALQGMGRLLSDLLNKMRPGDSVKLLDTYIKVADTLFSSLEGSITNKQIEGLKRLSNQLKERSFLYKEHQLWAKVDPFDWANKFIKEGKKEEAFSIALKNKDSFVQARQLLALAEAGELDRVTTLIPFLKIHEKKALVDSLQVEGVEDNLSLRLKEALDLPLETLESISLAERSDDGLLEEPVILDRESASVSLSLDSFAEESTISAKEQVEETFSSICSPKFYQFFKECLGDVEVESWSELAKKNVSPTGVEDIDQASLDSFSMDDSKSSLKPSSCYHLSLREGQTRGVSPELFKKIVGYDRMEGFFGRTKKFFADKVLANLSGLSVTIPMEMNIQFLPEGESVNLHFLGDIHNSVAIQLPKNIASLAGCPETCYIEQIRYEEDKESEIARVRVVDESGRLIREQKVRF